MSEDFLNTLPPEIWAHIFYLAGRKNIVNISLSCRKFAEIIKGSLLHILGVIENVKTFRKAFGYQAYPEQIKVLKKISESKASWNFIQAPMSAGKTSLMLLLALKYRSLVVINTNVYTTWIADIKKLGLTLHKDPEKSDVLIVHTKYPLHRNYFLQHQEMPSHNLVLTTYHFPRSCPVAFRFWLGINAKTQIFVDEAHLLNESSVYQLSLLSNGLTRFFLFSATKMSHISDVFTDVFKLKIKPIHQGYPKIRYTRCEIQDELSAKDIIQFLNQKSIEKYKHLVIFTSTALKNMRSWTKKIEEKTGRPTIVFNNTAITILERWKKKESAVLLCNYYTASEGVNFSIVDCAAFFHFHVMSISKARQSFGRVRRKNNPHSKIKVYFYESQDPILKLKGRLNQCYALYLDLPPFIRKSNYSVKQLLKQLSKDGYNPWKLTFEDLRVVFTYYETDPQIQYDRLSLPLNQLLRYSLFG